jgi:hypothetical protein
MARLMDTLDFPTPPLPLVTVITRAVLTGCFGSSGTDFFCGSSSETFLLFCFTIFLNLSA